MNSLCPSGLHKSLRNPKDCEAAPGRLDERVGRSLGAMARERRRAGYAGIDDTRSGATKGNNGSIRVRRACRDRSLMARLRTPGVKFSF
jgi:hypothetical protein